jgi:hypothetical protein
MIFSGKTGALGERVKKIDKSGDIIDNLPGKLDTVDT